MCLVVHAVNSVRFNSSVTAKSHCSFLSSVFCVFESTAEVTGELFTAWETLTRCGSDKCFAHSVLDAGQRSVAQIAVLTVQIFVPVLFQVRISVHQIRVSMEMSLPMCRRLPQRHVVIKTWYDWYHVACWKTAVTSASPADLCFRFLSETQVNFHIYDISWRVIWGIRVCWQFGWNSELLTIFWPYSCFFLFKPAYSLKHIYTLHFSFYNKNACEGAFKASCGFFPG